MYPSYYEKEIKVIYGFGSDTKKTYICLHGCSWATQRLVAGPVADSSSTIKLTLLSLMSLEA